MKTKSVYKTVIIALLLVSVTFNTEAQRRVVVRKHRTVAITRVHRNKVVYVHRRAFTPRVVRALPAAAIIVMHRRTKYYYHAGFYYATRPEGYVMVNPPAGIVVKVIPLRFVRIVAGTGTFFYAGGVFYTQVSTGYKVVQPPAGAQIDELPENAEEVMVDGKVFYEHNGTLYTKVGKETGCTYEASGQVED
jgi:hypothetical protein